MYQILAHVKSTELEGMYAYAIQIETNSYTVSRSLTPKAEVTPPGWNDSPATSIMQNDAQQN